MPRKQLPTKQRWKIVAQALYEGETEVEAFRRANYAIPKTINALRVNAHRVCTNANVLLILDELNKKALAASIATVEERKQILTDIARANLVSFIGEGGDIIIHDVKHNKALSKYAITYTKKGEPKKEIELHDPVKAIAELNKMERIGTHESDISINVLVQRIVNNLTVNNLNIEQLSDDELRLLSMGDNGDT